MITLEQEQEDAVRENTDALDRNTEAQEKFREVLAYLVDIMSEINDKLSVEVEIVSPEEIGLGEEQPDGDELTYYENLPKLDS